MSIHAVKTCEIGVVGLGTMGLNLTLNISDHGFSAAVFNRTASRTQAFMDEVKDRDIKAAFSLEDFVRSLKRPRAIILLVPAGPPVDEVVTGLMPYLESGDLIVDAGNSHYTDTDRRQRDLKQKNLLFMGMGVSGGEYGARYGSSLMPGGPREGYDRISPVLKEIAAKAAGEPCVVYLGSGSSGHYVKMVHNGIEYGLMQLIAETYDLLKRVMGMDNEDLSHIYSEWNHSELRSYLIEITANIFLVRDKETGRHLIDLISDVTEQKGTGIWTVLSAMDLHEPLSVTEMAVMMRHLSNYTKERARAAEVLGRSSGHEQELSPGNTARLLKNALYSAFIITYAQGFALLRRAVMDLHYDFKLADVAKIWRGGCIIRSAVLEDIMRSFTADPELPNLLLHSSFYAKIEDRDADFRNLIKIALESGIPVPGFMAALSYLDAYRSERLPSNLIQAQRDYFGSHTYGRIDKAGFFHTVWTQSHP